MKRIVVLVGCMTVLLLGGCFRQKDKYILDGPGMVYEPPWTAFTISQNDSSSQYSFWFTVVDNGDQALLTGECCDENGNSYVEEEGIEISVEDLWQLRWMDLQTLDAPTQWPDDLERPLDMREITLSVTLSDGTVVKKDASSELSTEIYKLLLPYLKNN